MGGNNAETKSHDRRVSFQHSSACVNYAALLLLRKSSLNKKYERVNGSSQINNKFICVRFGTSTSSLFPFNISARCTKNTYLYVELKLEKELDAAWNLKAFLSSSLRWPGHKSRAIVSLLFLLFFMLKKKAALGQYFCKSSIDSFTIIAKTNNTSHLFSIISCLLFVERDDDNGYKSSPRK